MDYIIANLKIFATNKSFFLKHLDLICEISQKDFKIWRTVGTFLTDSITEAFGKFVNNDGK